MKVRLSETERLRCRLCMHLHLHQRSIIAHPYPHSLSQWEGGLNGVAWVYSPLLPASLKGGTWSGAWLPVISQQLAY